MPVRIFSAGSLKPYFDILIPQFARTGETYEINYMGSLECTRRIYQGQYADLVAVADYKLLEDLKNEGIINEYFCWASNEIVLCYTDKSKFAEDIDESNWFKVIANPEVKVGHTSPDHDPAGYRALLVIQLAERYYRDKGFANNLLTSSHRQVFANASLLVNNLLEGKVDYIFEYFSVARNNNFSYIRLPQMINLSDPNESYYKNAVVLVKNYKDGYSVINGGPIIYAFAILPKCEDSPVVKELAQLLQSPVSHQLLKKNYLKPIFM